MNIRKSKRGAGVSPARAVHQLVPRMAWGDAVGNQVRYLRSLLRGWGYASDIYAEQWDEECREEVRPADDYLREADADSALLIHHSFESRLVPLVARAPGRKALVYHNVTPARLFAGLDRKVAAGCAAARDELLALRPHVEHAWAYSHFSAEELSAAGFPGVAVMPFAVDWRAFDTPPEPSLRAELDDGCANILFVGRAVPSKRVEDVLRVFAAYQRLYQPSSRLVVAGYLNRDTAYGATVLAQRELLGAERVLFLGRVGAAQLSACFATATAYLSMSRHEGFGVPLLEAMSRNVPVVAYGAAAVPETMGGAGLTTLRDAPLEVAGLLAVLERDAALRAQVVAAQRERLADLGQDAVAARVREALAPFLEGQGAPRPSGLGDASTVTVVCPGFDAAPDAPLSRLARAVAEKLPGARLWTVRREVLPVQRAPREERLGAATLWRFTADEPSWSSGPAPGAGAPPSSSLETGVRCAPGPVLFAGADEAVAREVAPRIQARAWGVWEAGRPPDAAVRQALGPRLRELPADADVTSVAAELARALESRGGTHAR